MIRYKPGDMVKLIAVDGLVYQLQSGNVTLNSIYKVKYHDLEQWPDGGGAVFFYNNKGEVTDLKAFRFVSAKKEIKNEIDWLDAIQQNFKEI